MKTYKIIGKTNGYIASRDPQFNGNCVITIDSGMTLDEARAELLRMFNNDHDMNCSNWGMAVIMTRNRVYGANPTFKDGTRSYEYDSRTYIIEEEDEQ